MQGIYRGKEGGKAFAQTVDYRYNIRGWLTHINDPDVTSSEDLFAMRLMYEDNTNLYPTNTRPKYNGNVTFHGRNRFHISYNELNLPKIITPSNSTSDIRYTYTANGEKVAKTNLNGDSYFYAGRFVRKDAGSGLELEYILFDEGMVVYDDVTNNYTINLDLVKHM